MRLYAALQAIRGCRHTAFPPILAATAPLAHAAGAFGRAFRPSAVEAATATSRASSARNTTPFTENLRSVRSDYRPGSAGWQPGGRKHQLSRCDPTPVPCGLQQIAPVEMWV